MQFKNSCNLARHRYGTVWWSNGNVETCRAVDYVKRHCCDVYCCDINSRVFGYNENNEEL